MYILRSPRSDRTREGSELLCVCVYLLFVSYSLMVDALVAYSQSLFAVRETSKYKCRITKLICGGLKYP
jgi:hypothetical protein